MHRESLIGLVAAALAACTTAPPLTSAELAAKNRPPEERCVRAQPGRSATRPGMTQAEVQAEARAAARRGELDKECDWL